MNQTNGKISAEVPPRIRTWRERIGVSPSFPLHAPNNVERAMEAEIAELREALPHAGYLTDAQITAGAAVKCEHGQAIGRNVAIDVFDAMKPAGAQKGGAA
jgi:hypothetical protein